MMIKRTKKVLHSNDESKYGYVFKVYLNYANGLRNYILVLLLETKELYVTNDKLSLYYKKLKKKLIVTTEIAKKKNKKNKTIRSLYSKVTSCILHYRTLALHLSYIDRVGVNKKKPINCLTKCL